MKTQHTPDLWYYKRTSAGQALIISETNGRNVAVAYDEKAAPILAASPELLAHLTACAHALEEAKGKLDQFGCPSLAAFCASEAEQARAVVAKAKGEQA